MARRKKETYPEEGKQIKGIVNKLGQIRGASYDQQAGPADKSGMNDISWYAKNSQLLQDAASFSFNNALGTRVNFNDYKFAEDIGVDLQPQTIPGIMEIDIALAVGRSDSKVSPLNVAANNLYSYVRYMNSGSKNYDAPDLMNYILAMDTLYSLWNWGQRAYGEMRQYSQTNRYYPKAIVEASGFDFNDLEQHLADFRQYLNILASKIAAFCVPNNMSYIVRHSWLFSNVYKDSNIAKSQLYIFRPANYYEYVETEGLGYLKCHATSSPRYTFAKYKEMMDGLVSAMQYSEDIGVMSGDILKAFGQERLFTLSAITEDYEVTPVYQEEILTQIHNLSCYGIWGFMSAHPDQFDITQTADGILKYDPILPHDQANTDIGRLATLPRTINFPWDNVSPADVMVGTRLATMWTEEDDGYHLHSCGSDFAVNMRAWYLTVKGQAMATQNILTYLNTTSQQQPDAVAYYLALASNFDWHPLIYTFGKDGEVIKMRHIVGDLANYTLMGANDLYKLHETALLSEFNVPQLGSF